MVVLMSPANIQRLGTNTLVVFPAGGFNGERLQQLLEREGCMFRAGGGGGGGGGGASCQ